MMYHPFSRTFSRLSMNSPIQKSCKYNILSLVWHRIQTQDIDSLIRIAHLRIAPQWAILRWAFLTFTIQSDWISLELHQNNILIAFNIGLWLAIQMHCFNSSTLISFAANRMFQTQTKIPDSRGLHLLLPDNKNIRMYILQSFCRKHLISCKDFEC